jgi:hypothetical protein
MMKVILETRGTHYIRFTFLLDTRQIWANFHLFHFIALKTFNINSRHIIDLFIYKNITVKQCFL